MLKRQIFSSANEGILCLRHHARYCTGEFKEIIDMVFVLRSLQTHENIIGNNSGNLNTFSLIFYTLSYSQESHM